MLPLTIFRNNPELVKNGLLAKGETTGFEALIEVDNRHRAMVTKLNAMRSERNKTSELIAKSKRTGQDVVKLITAMRDLSEQIKTLESDSAELHKKINAKLEYIPNLPHESVPQGSNAEDNMVVRVWGEKPEFDFEIDNHLDLGAKLDLFDFNRGAKIAGSGFPLYTGQGARLERALINFMLDYHIENYGFTEIFPPFMTNSDASRTTGQLPKFAEDMYRTDIDGLYLIPTAEVPVTNIHRDEIIPEHDLPIFYVAYSACFRREAGSYGKDTRGFLRLHQFNKVELVKFVNPETSYAELEALTKQAESILQALGLHYRVVELCSGDLSFASAKCYDLEVWSPGEEKWLEVSSCSNFEAFQARRGNIRYRRDNDRKVDFVHTLNGSGVATPRLLVALLETYQTEDGTIILPPVLQEYMGRRELK
ncbi:MAG: serine--tRNA ligase [Candidatus Marinimicrobia bacterium]|nr:serine--tRNA ligase [Candidatus Neomarinimicrobiota bacterium]